MTKVGAELTLNDGTHCVVDSEDFERVNEHHWTAHYICGGCYPETKIAGKAFFLSRFIVDAPKGFEVDHINHDTRDNRRCNLRICTSSQNQHNRVKKVVASSRFKGVRWDAKARKWYAQIGHEGRQEHLGSFSEERDAAMAYDARAKELWGEFASLNGGA